VVLTITTNGGSATIASLVVVNQTTSNSLAINATMASIGYTQVTNEITTNISTIACYKLGITTGTMKADFQV
jgi:hypothetical protein